jgi:hypothetical protein
MIQSESNGQLFPYRPHTTILCRSGNSLWLLTFSRSLAVLLEQSVKCLLLTDCKLSRLDAGMVYTQ